MLYKAIAAAGFLLFACVSVQAAQRQKEIVLSEETKALIEAYQKNPTKDIEDALYERVEMSYERMLVRQRTELDKLKKESKNKAEIEKKQKAFERMVANKEKGISQMIKRLTEEKSQSDGSYAQTYLPIEGTDNKLFIAYTPVTNAEYALFASDTKRAVPLGWYDGKMPEGREKHPVTGVSYQDAVDYCKWLSKKDGKHTYRLPTEKEWELAAGETPEGSDINCGSKKGTTPIDAFEETLSAAGAVDMWGNVWEWTSTSKATARGILLMNIKGGSWATPCAKCRTEYRAEAREPRFADNTLGFRVVREE